MGGDKGRGEATCGVFEAITRPWPCEWRWCPRGSYEIASRKSACEAVAEYGADEPVLEAARDTLEVAHAAGAGGVPALGLLAPLVCARISTISKPTLSTTGNEQDIHDLSLAAG